MYIGGGFGPKTTTILPNRPILGPKPRGPLLSKAPKSETEVTFEEQAFFRVFQKNLVAPLALFEKNAKIVT